MRKIDKIIFLGAALFVLAAGSLLAQPGGAGVPGGPGGAGGFGGRGGGGFGGAGGAPFDPAQVQQQMQDRMAQYFKEQLAITNDEEWSVIQPRISKVSQLKMESAMGGLSMGALRGLMGGGGRVQAGQAGPAGQAGGRQRAGGNLAALFPSMPEVDALQAAIDNQAPNADLKAAMAKVRQAKKVKQDALLAAQEDLRQVLTLRQEAILVSMGVLD